MVAGGFVFSDNENMSGDDIQKTIVILGGGTAGWMAANLMAAKWAKRGFDISLVESPDIGIIGVGEGSTPQLKGFMDSLLNSRPEVSEAWGTTERAADAETAARLKELGYL